MASTRGTPRTLPGRRRYVNRGAERVIVRGDGEGEEEVIDHLSGVDDWIAEIALARRALLRELANEPIVRCGRPAQPPASARHSSVRSDTS
jgi:hypothetical protein